MIKLVSLNDEITPDVASEGEVNTEPSVSSKDRHCASITKQENISIYRICIIILKQNMIEKFFD